MRRRRRTSIAELERRLTAYQTAFLRRDTRLVSACRHLISAGQRHNQVLVRHERELTQFNGDLIRVFTRIQAIEGAINLSRRHDPEAD